MLMSMGVSRTMHLPTYYSTAGKMMKGEFLFTAWLPWRPLRVSPISPVASSSRFCLYWYPTTYMYTLDMTAMRRCYQSTSGLVALTWWASSQDGEQHAGVPAGELHTSKDDDDVELDVLHLRLHVPGQDR